MLVDNRYNWPGINSNSVVFDIGAFEGIWAEEIAKRYNPKLYLFEPQYGSHIQRLRRRLQADNYMLFDFALGERNGEFSMGEYNTDGASFLIDKEHASETRKSVGTGRMIDAADFLRSRNFDNIDLTAMNIEGYEFILIPYLHNEGLISRFQRLMVQFHLFVDDAEAKYLDIEKRLSETHTMLWNEFPAWVAWVRK